MVKVKGIGHLFSGRRITTEWGYCENKDCNNYKIIGWYDGAYCKMCGKNIIILEKLQNQQKPNTRLFEK